MWTPLVLVSRPPSAPNWNTFATAGFALLLLVGSHVASATTKQECENKQNVGGKPILYFHFIKKDGKCVYDLPYEARQGLPHLQFCPPGMMLATFEDEDDWKKLHGVNWNVDFPDWYDYLFPVGAFKTKKAAVSGVNDIRWMKYKELTDKDDKSCDIKDRCNVDDTYKQVQKSYLGSDEGGNEKEPYIGYDAKKKVLSDFGVMDGTRDHLDFKDLKILCQDATPRPTTPKPTTTPMPTTTPKPTEAPTTEEAPQPELTTEVEVEETDAPVDPEENTDSGGGDGEEENGENSPFVSTINFLLPIAAVRLLL